MKKYLFFVQIVIWMLMLMLGSCSNSRHDIDFKVVALPEEGWMNGGYGTLVFHLKNNTDKEIKASSVVGSWHVGNKKYNHWDHNPGLTLSVGEEKKSTLIAWMPPQTEQFAGATTPRIEGKAVFLIDNDVKTIPFSVEVPIAKMSSPLIGKRGKYVELLLQEKTWELVNHREKMIDYLDEVYLKMYELTGVMPYNGDILTLKESPENPYFGYAGNPIILNKLFVPTSVARFDNDEIDFGWLNMIGLVFESHIGKYFNYGFFTACQANIRLSYAIEQLCRPNTKLKIKSWVDGKSLLSGKEFVEEYFLPKGKVYYDDKFRTWESMTADECHALLYTIIQEDGWDVMKKFYKVYALMYEEGVDPPKGIERLFLAFTVLDVCCERDLVPLYNSWRLPINYQTISQLTEEYQLENYINRIN